MVSRARNLVLAAGSLAVSGMGLCAAGQAQVFVVGKDTATTGMLTEFRPTRVELSNNPITLDGERDLIRMMLAEQGFAHRGLPMGGQGLTLHANGVLQPDRATIEKALYERGISAAPGDRVTLTNIKFERDRIILDFDGGPYLPHRFLRHVTLNNMNIVPYNPNEVQALGSRLTLLFEGYVPTMSAAELKALLQPVVDFNNKTSEQAYADTLPAELKEAVASHEVLVGMNHRMVLAALGQPEIKVREKIDDDGAHYEEWIYGHAPQTIRFVRFVGDRVIRLEIAALGKPLEIHDKEEMNGYKIKPQQREIALGDEKPEIEEGQARKMPSLKRDGEDLPNSPSLVKMPDAAPLPPAKPTDSVPAATPAPVSPSNYLVAVN